MNWIVNYCRGGAQSRIDGYQVDAKHNFEDGLERRRQLPPGLVVLDPLITDNASRVR